MKKNKIIIYLLITIVSLLSLSSEVKGEGDVKGDGLTDGEHNASLSNTTQGTKNYEHGVRLSVYEYSDGKLKKIGHSVDIFRNETYYNEFISRNAYYRAVWDNGLYSKFDYIENNIKTKDINDKFKSNNKNVNQLYYIKDNNLIGSNRKTYKDLGFDFPKIWGYNLKVEKDAFKNNFLAFLKKNGNNNYQKLLEFMGANNDYSCTNTYIVAEIIGMIYITQGYRYLGTAYELSVYKDKYSSTLGPALGSLPRALYITGKEQESEQSEFIQKYLSKINGKIPDDVSAELARGKNGYGVNIFWLKGICNKCEYTNPNDFKLNAGKGEDVTRNGVTIPYCCTQFSETEYPDLVQDYPICGYCDNKTKVTVKDDSSNDSNNKISTGTDGTIYENNSSRCLYAKTPENGDPDKVTNYSIEDNLENKINNNTCLPITNSNDQSKQGLIEVNLNNYCYIKCVEEDIFSIPKDPHVTINTDHFVWPTSPSTARKFGNGYPLNAEGKTTCRIIVKAVDLQKSGENKNDILNKCATALTEKKLADELNTFEPNIVLTHDKDPGKKYYLESFNETTKCATALNPDDVFQNTTCSNVATTLSNELKKYNANTNDNNVNFNKKVKALRNFRFSITKNMGFKLNGNLNTYRNSSNGVPIYDLSTDGTWNPQKVKMVGYSNIPVTMIYDENNTSKKQTTTISYEKFLKGTLTLTINSISKHFTNSNPTNISKVIKPMTCKVDYEATRTNDVTTYGYENTTWNGSSYLCGPGTKHDGKVVNHCLSNNGILNISCATNECFDTTDNNNYCSIWTSCPGCIIDSNEWSTKLNQFKIKNSDGIAKQKTQDYFDTHYPCYDSDGGDPNPYQCSDNSANSGFNVSDSKKANVYLKKISELENTYKNASEDARKNQIQTYIDTNVEECKSGSQFKCPEGSDLAGLDQTTCVTGLKNEGWDEDDAKSNCYSAHCYLTQIGPPDGTPCKCKAGTRYEGMNLNYCIVNPLKNGNAKNKNDACTNCQSECDNLNEIIYRPIDLNNPFPSITGITDNSKLGRLPGTNWITGIITLKNTQTKVSTYITNNRGVTTTDVYKKTPLYTFELNASTIAKIKEYNRMHSYDDLEFDCNGSTRTACISKDFVHNTRYGFIDNTGRSSCAGITSSNFYKCSE